MPIKRKRKTPIEMKNKEHVRAKQGAIKKPQKETRGETTNIRFRVPVRTLVPSRSQKGLPARARAILRCQDHAPGQTAAEDRPQRPKTNKISS